MSNLKDYFDRHHKNPELERKQQMSKEQRAREAIDTMARNTKEHIEKNGGSASFEECKREAQKIAERVERKGE